MRLDSDIRVNATSMKGRERLNALAKVCEILVLREAKVPRLHPRRLSKGNSRRRWADEEDEVHDHREVVSVLSFVLTIRPFPPVPK